MWEVWGQRVCRFVFVVCGCRFANDFFCKIVSRGSLIYRWCYWKMFTVNFYAIWFDSRGNSTGNKLLTLDWEKAVYWLLFTLANTLGFSGQVFVIIHLGVILDGKSSQEYLVNALEFFKDPFLVLHFFCCALTLFRSVFSHAGEGRGQKVPFSQNLSYVSYNYETWYSYTLPNLDLKIAPITWHTPWVLLASAFFLQETSKFCYIKKWRYRLYFDT